MNEDNIEIKKETPVVEDKSVSEKEIKPKVDKLGRSYATGQLGEVSVISIFTFF